MVVSFVIAFCAGTLGWFKAARQGGQTNDRVQYAAAHAIPAFLISLVLLTIGHNLDWLPKI